jgi:hypothetical protein
MLMLISLLLCVAASVLWVRSYAGSDYLAHGRSGVSSTEHSVTGISHQITWTRGQIQITKSEMTSYSLRIGVAVPPKRSYWSYGRLGKGHLYWDSLPERTMWNRLGFAEIRTGWMSSFADESRKGFAIPAWLPVLAFGLWPALWIVRVVRWRSRLGVGHCRECGYDLRATPKRCPECGATPVSAGGR